jgi:hypothetical protein
LLTALRLLIRLQIKGWFRSFGRGLRTVKGVLLALLGLFFFLSWAASVLPYLIMPDPELSGSVQRYMHVIDLRTYGPMVLLLFCLAQVLLSSGERTIYFTPAEVNFLFSGPFSRRQILGYKIAMLLLLGLLSTLFLTVVFRPHAHSFLTAFLGVALVTTFLQLFRMFVGLLAVTLGTSLYSRGRRLLFLGAALLAASVAVQAGWPAAGEEWRQWLADARQTLAWQAVTLPFRWFIEVFVANRVWPDLILYLGLGVAVNLVLLVLVFALDTQYLEAAATSSERTYAALQRLRRGGLAAAGPVGGKVRFRLPMFPRWGGVGPIFWRQLTTALRGLGRLAGAFAVFVVSLIGPLVVITVQDRNPWALGPELGVPALIMTVLLTPLLPFDFRGDIDRMALLKTLPLRPVWIALGQMLTPVLLATALQWLLLVVIGVLAGWRHYELTDVVLDADTFREHGAIAWVACFFYAPPINFLVFGLENLIFLLFPTRTMAASPGDFQAMGRNIVYTLAKLFVLAVVGFGVVVCGGLTYFLTGQSFAAAVAAGWPVVFVAGAGMVPLVGLAFCWYDVGRDTPA